MANFYDPRVPESTQEKLRYPPNLSLTLAHERFQIFPPIADELADGERIDVVSRAHRNDLFAVTISGTKGAIILLESQCARNARVEF